MRGTELEYTRTLRRRRLGVLGLFFLSLLAWLALNGWTFTPVWTLFQNDEGDFFTGDPYGDWIYGVCDGERQLIVVSRGGRLEGGAGLDTLPSPRFPDWCGLPVVDHPDLADWQADLDRLQALTRAPQASGHAVLDAAREAPVSVLYLQPIAEWIRGDAANAAAFLDAVADRPMRFDHPNGAVVQARRQYFADLIDEALDRAAYAGVAPERVERWLAQDQIAGRGSSLLKLAAMVKLDGAAGARALERLTALAPRERADLYLALAPRLADDGGYAALLARQLRYLPRQDQPAAAHRLLTREGTSIQFPIALLAELRQGFGRGDADLRLETYMTIADRLRDEDEAPLLLTRHLRDLPDMQRRMAATYLLSLDDPGETAFALGVLRSLGDLHPISRPQVVYAALQSTQFDDRAVQQACLLAIRTETQGEERQALLSAMLTHRSLDADLLSRIRAELG